MKTCVRRARLAVISHMVGMHERQQTKVDLKQEISSCNSSQAMAPPDLDKLCPKSFSAFYDSQKEELTLAVGTDGKHGTDLSVKNLNRHDYGLDVYGNLSNALPSGGGRLSS